MNAPAPGFSAHYACGTASSSEVEKLAFDLSGFERAIPAAHLLGSLPSILDDADGGIAEVLRRDAEMDASPQTGISLEQLDEQVDALRS